MLIFILFSSLKPEDIQLNGKENQQILTSESLKLENVMNFCLKANVPDHL